MAGKLAEQIKTTEQRLAEAEEEERKSSGDAQAAARWKVDKLKERLVVLNDRLRQQQEQSGAVVVGPPAINPAGATYIPPPQPAQAVHADPLTAAEGTEAAAAAWEEEEEEEEEEYEADEEDWKQWGAEFGGEEEEEEEIGLRLCCPLCGAKYINSALPPHLAGHFALLAVERAEAGEGGAAGEADAGEEMLEMLKRQQAEVDAMMDRALRDAGAHPDQQPKRDPREEERQARLKEKQQRQPQTHGRPRRQTPQGRGHAARVEVRERLQQYHQVKGRLPECWDLERQGQNTSRLHPVVPSLDLPGEYELVWGHFLRTLGRPATAVSLQRIQNTAVYRKYDERRKTFSGAAAEETLMFHGCRQAKNEPSIISNGFQVSACRSGGANFGTWVAYIASYSDGGFTFDDALGVRHIFICVVLAGDIRLDDRMVMRVVGQDCAYPMYLLQYYSGAPPRLLATAIKSTASKEPEKAKAKAKKTVKKTKR
eukprot:Hpha_TRINITY_DN15252_c0_g1::TRINITY_DN15252_c0_g1_i2::g.68083::m.68083